MAVYFKGTEVGLTMEAQIDLPKLNAPTITRSAGTIKISNPSSNGNYVSTFNIYDNGVKVGSQAVDAATIDLVIYDVGVHKFTVTCVSAQFEESQQSNSVDFTIYTITNNLTNCTTSNSATKISDGVAYSATLTANENYYLPTVATITMGGTSGDYYAPYKGIITITNVTGDIVITASAEAQQTLVPPILSLSDAELTIIGPNNAEVKYAEKYVLYGNDTQIAEFEVEQPGYEVQDVTGATYGFVLNDNNYYESTNQKKGNTFSYCKVVFDALKVASKVTFNCINYGESSYDYGELSQLNQDLSLSTNDDGADGSTLVKKNFKGQSSTSVVAVTYDSVSPNDYITVKYRKDGSGDTGNDSLQFQIVTEAL
jgi:hypothetical protein